MFKPNEATFLIETTGVTRHQLQSVTGLLDEGMTVPFIARYRKEVTGNLDEVKIQGVSEQLAFLRDLNERKATVLKTIGEQEQLTPELEKQIADCFEKQALEDLYLPYKPKRRTRALMAKERGLEPLAMAILAGAVDRDPGEMAAAYVAVGESGLEDVETVLTGASDILAEQFSETASLRQVVRTLMMRKGRMRVTVTDEWKDKRSKFEQYYEYEEPVAGMPSHRVLAVRRGEREKVLKSRIDLDMDHLVDNIHSLVFSGNHVHAPFLLETLRDALKRLVLPSIELDVRSELKRNADEEAIRVFASNLEHLLLSPPAGNLCVLGVDPGYRTGCKLVVLDDTGKLLAHDTIFPTKPAARTTESAETVEKLLEHWHFQAVAIGNGTASRETEQFFRSTLGNRCPVVVVNEAGASVYSASPEAREEFPDHDVTVRGSVSIGRRFQDPLSELVKIEPRAIGVGQYQHDVNQSLLKRKLDTTVESVVNRVGVDVNTASWHLLKYVAGIGDTVARNIVAYRDENGRFENRNQLKKVRLFGEKAFLQSAGFLRIRDGENPLDATGIHPESYAVVTEMADSIQLNIEKLIQNETGIRNLDVHRFVSEQFGLPTLQDIIRELRNPGRDPRDSFTFFSFTDGVNEIEDLYEGMIVNGIVTNVTNFGAFVDVGVHQDGLVHISELSHRFVRAPEEVVAVGQQVQVKVLSVDLALKRISLSIRQANDS